MGVLTSGTYCSQYGRRYSQYSGNTFLMYFVRINKSINDKGFGIYLSTIKIHTFSVTALLYLIKSL